MSNIKEQIKAEIEGRITFAEKCADAACEKNLHSALEASEMLIRQYKSLLAFIDSLPEEKPSENLNDEIKKFIEEYGYERGEDKLLIAIVARHFAEWQKEQMMKDAVVSEIGITSGGILLRDLRIEDFDYEDVAKIIIVKNEE